MKDQFWYVLLFLIAAFIKRQHSWKIFKTLAKCVEYTEVRKYIENIKLKIS